MMIVRLIEGSRKKIVMLCIRLTEWIVCNYFHVFAVKKQKVTGYFNYKKI